MIRFKERFRRLVVEIPRVLYYKVLQILRSMGRDRVKLLNAVCFRCDLGCAETLCFIET